MKICSKTTVVGLNILLVSSLVILIGVASRQNTSPQIKPTPQVQLRSVAHHPIMFVENQGQWDSKVAYMARKQGMTAWLLKDGITFQFEKRNAQDHAQGVTMQMTFEGASEQMSVEGQGKQSSKHNFFIGNDRAQWRSGVSSYAKVVYNDLYAGIGLCLREHEGWLEYDLLLSRGADLRDVVIHCEGLEEIKIDENGILVMETGFGPITQEPPTAWYESLRGERIPVTCNFRIIDDQRYGFQVEDDLGLALVIDPGLEWSTFLGASGNEEVLNIALNASGDIIVVGVTNSDSFPATPGAYDTTYNGSSSDGFVSCLSANGSTLLWSTYLGASSTDMLFDLDLDDSGLITVAGMTTSPDFPTTPGAYDTSHNGGNDAIVARLSADGSQLIYSTFLGSSDEDWALTIDVSGSGEAFVGGYTGSSHFPTTTAAYDTSYNGGLKDAFVTCLNTDGSDLIYSTFLGGSAMEGIPIQQYYVNTRVMGLALSTSGDLVVAGCTRSNDFPTTPSAYDTTHNGADDMFVLRLNSTGSGLVYSTFLGGSYSDGSFSSEVGLDESGVVTIAGWTTSSDFPTTPGAYDASHNGSYDVFVARLDATGSNLPYSTFIGGPGWDDLTAGILDASSNMIITGSCMTGFPTTPGAYDTTFNGGIQDAFVSRLSPDGNGQADLLYSTFLGGSGSGWDWGNALALIADSTVIVAGLTESADFPITPGVYDSTFNGGIDGYICRFGVYVGVQEEPTQNPLEYITLSSVFPNPSYRQFNYSISLENRQKVEVNVFDITGRLIETLIDRVLPAGHREFAWQPKEKLSSGTYFIQLRIGNHTETRKILLIK